MSVLRMPEFDEIVGPEVRYLGDGVYYVVDGDLEAFVQLPWNHAIDGDRRVRMTERMAILADSARRMGDASARDGAASFSELAKDVSHLDLVRREREVNAVRAARQARAAQLAAAGSGATDQGNGDADKVRVLTRMAADPELSDAMREAASEALKKLGRCADANLTAASPEMLAALDAVVDGMGTYEDTGSCPICDSVVHKGWCPYERIMAARASARGEVYIMREHPPLTDAMREALRKVREDA